KTEITGFETQRELFKMYSKYVNKYKAQFFKDVQLNFVQGERSGMNVKMLEGRRKGEPPLDLIDCRTSGGVFNLGHCHPEIIKALKEGIDAGLDIGDHHIISAQRSLLAKQLAELLPGDISKTQYCVGGGEAIDLAIKLARAITRRKKIVAAEGGYHGVTGLALGAGDPRFKDIFLWNPPDYIKIPFGDIESAEKVLKEDVACILMETIQATGGIQIPQESYFASIREKCDEKGIIMIADEVQTGLGRTGQMWAIHGGLYENERIVPDIMVLAKGMSAGYYPMATCSYKPFIEEVFKEDPFVHISTTGGSELGCYVTRKMLDIISKPEFLKHVRDMGKLFEAGLNELMQKYPEFIVDIRGRGLMWGVEFINEIYGQFFTVNMIKSGVFADYCGNHKATNKLMPPLIIEPKDINEIMKRLDSAIKLFPKAK
ncbi:MAG: class-III pyridoxal-phosphate-dependent aminotransferase, partial [Candidatus Helarchaeota archaeon]